MKKTLAIILCGLMMLNLLFIGAFAADEEFSVTLEVQQKNGNLISVKTSYTLPAGASASDVQLTLDMGDGTVLPAYFSEYRYEKAGTYTVKLTGKLNDKTATDTKSVTVAKEDGFKKTPSCSVTNSKGGGDRDLKTICDNVFPTSKRTAYDTYTGSTASEVWFAINFDHKVTVTDVIFAEGAHFDNGGWFVGTPSVQLYIDGNWVDAASTISPAYPQGNTHADHTTECDVFTFTLGTATKCEGVRVIGVPGGSKTFAACGELTVKYSAVENPTYVDFDKDVRDAATVICSQLNPTGNGDKSLDVLRDGYIPTAENGNTKRDQYDTYINSNNETTDFFGYIFRKTVELTDVTFSSGASFNNGGWFKDGSMKIEAYVDGKWVAVDASVSPALPSGNDYDTYKDVTYSTYKLTLTKSVKCDGFRVIGQSGGSKNFAACSELDFSYKTIQNNPATGDNAVVIIAMAVAAVVGMLSAAVVINNKRYSY